MSRATNTRFNLPTFSIRSSHMLRARRPMSSIRTCWATAVNSAKEKAGRERPVFSFLKVPEWTGLRRGNSVASPRRNLIESLLMSHDHTHSHHHHDEERWKHD